MRLASTSLVAVLSTLIASASASFAVLDGSTSSNPALRFNPLATRDLPTGTCDQNTPCVNGACCGSNNLCGYSSKECGTGCRFNCDAKAQCGVNGVPGKQKCPLNVCCSKFGFCGATSDFCGDGCDSTGGGCGDVQRPSCGSGSVNVGQRTIGYYESWSNTRKCQSVSPEQLNLDGYTHLNFAFAFFDPSSFAITPMDSNAASLYSRFTALKQKKPSLQTWISVGGWSFTDPGATRTAFSDMASTSGNRAKFISGLKSFMSSYGFDGVDLDWEYPGADDRGGKDGDAANYVSLVKEMRAAFGGQYGLTVTLPTSYWYLQHFDLPGMQDSVDWFNLMAYDLHGTWDAASKFVGPFIAPHTNITEIDLGLDLLWRAGVSGPKVVLGQGFYGRSFTLKDSSCNTPNGNCQFSGPANAGPCSNAPGILDLQEINDIISKNNLTPVRDQKAGVKWITWGGNQWVSYDDADTFAQKRTFASSRCLGGLMVWAIDQIDQTGTSPIGAAGNGVTAGQRANANQAAIDQSVATQCYATLCGDKCKKGTKSVAQFNGQPGDLSTADRCPAKQYRTWCCADGTTLGKCQYRGYRGVGLSCIKGCADGETELFTNTNSHGKNGDQNCNGGLQSYCCSNFKPAPSKTDLEHKGEDLAKDAAENAAENVALDIAAKAFCRVAVPALLLPLELAEDAIPIIGEILDIAEIAATPALIQLCVKGIEKEGKAEFKVFGKKHTLSMNSPKSLPTSRPPPKSHDPPETAPACTPGDSSAAARLMKRAGKKRKCGDDDGTNDPSNPDPVYVADPKNPTSTAPVKRLQCDGGNGVAGVKKYPQACLHYMSVRDTYGFRTLTCPVSAIPGDRVQAPEVNIYYNQHKPGWREGLGLACDADEYPPAYFLKGSTGARIRLLDASQNRGAGNIWSGACPEKGYEVVGKSEKVAQVMIKGKPQKVTTTTYTTRRVFQYYTMDFVNMPNYAGDQWGITTNKCWPRDSNLHAYPGFALLNEDNYYNNAGQSEKDQRALYSIEPRQPARRRMIDPLLPDVDAFGFENYNSTHVLSDEELEQKYGIYKCADDDCTAELEALGVQSLPVVATDAELPRNRIATATPVDEIILPLATPSATGASDTSARKPLVAPLPVVTRMV